MNNEIASSIISRMTFSAVDYVMNRESIVEDAVKQYCQQTGEQSLDIRNGMVILLDRSYAERKLLSVCAAELPDHLRDGSHFRIFVNDTEVVGKVRISPKVISVEITSPFQGEMAGSELEMLAPVIWTERPEKGSEANESGRQKSISLLVDIYYSLLR